MGILRAMDQQRILVVEDDQIQRLMLAMQLQNAGYDVIAVENGERAVDLLSYKCYDLLITDLLLPRMHGMQVIAEARARCAQISVIIITGAANTTSVIAALNQQVHRYLLKPVSPPELLQNVAEVLTQRRQIAERATTYQLQAATGSEVIKLRIGPLVIEPQRHRVTSNDRAILLTSTEFALLIYLIQHRGSVVSPLAIARDVLHYSCSLDEARALVKSLIHRLRQKIEAPHPGLEMIRNVRGAGYRLLDEDEL